MLSCKAETAFRAHLDLYSSRPGIKEMAEWLDTTDFYTAPASTRYHGSHPGGLVEHSMNVFYRLLQLRDMLSAEQQKQISDETCFVVAGFHDACKANFYKPEKRNRKNPETGKWEEYDTYGIDEAFPMGHGEKSSYIVRSMMPLTEQEALAIRWHMGPYNVGPRGPQEVIDVWKMCRDSGEAPLVLLLHLADHLATFLDENDNVSAELKITSLTAPKIELADPRATDAPINSLEELYCALYGPVYQAKDPEGKFWKFLVNENRSDFFTAPASTGNYGACEGGLANVSCRMFGILKELVEAVRWPTTIETVSTISLLHGIGLIHTFQTEMRKKKDQEGNWIEYPFISVNEEIPYGPWSAKSVYMLQPFMRLSREEAISIRWITGTIDDKNAGAAHEKFPMAALAHAAYLMAAYT